MFKDVYKEFKSVKALNGLNLVINKGEIYGLLGHNGAGKTTSLRLMLGLLNVTAGEISVFDVDPIKNGDQIRAKCGVLSENIGLYEPLTVYENLQYYAQIYNMEKEEYNKSIDEFLEKFEIIDKKHMPVKGFSTGMKKKVALIRAVLHKPEIVILDEPTNGLDPVSIVKLRELMIYMSEKYKTTFIITTHNLDEVAKTCDKLSILKHGVDVVTKSLKDMKEKEGSDLSAELLNLYMKVENDLYE